MAPEHIHRLPHPARAPARARGFAFIAALFLLVVLGAFAAFVVSIGANAQASSAVAIQGVRAYEAANAGLEWATYQELSPTGIVTPPDCFASPSSVTLPAAFGGFSVSVRCVRTPAYPNYYEEGSQRVAIYDFTATASMGTAGSAEYAERQLEARVEQCKDPYGTSPAYTCY